RTARLVRRAGRAAPAEGRRPGPARRAGRLGEHRTEPGGRPAPAAGRTPEGRMTEQATTTHAGTIPSQPGPRPAADAAPGPRGGTVTSGSDTAGPAVIPGAGPAAPSAARPGERATVRLRDTGGEEPARYAPEWLQLREPADAVARSHDLLDPLRIRLANLPQRADGLVIHDIGCGTGSMGRWLAPHLDGAQHWILHDRDPYLLHFAAVGAPRSSADGSRVSLETRPRAGAGCPALLTLSVAGRVELTAPHPMDQEITEAFNAHQRRGGLLGPDAATAAADAFAAHGATVRLNPSPWRLGPDQAALTEQWLRGWVGAAVEERPELADRAGSYLKERLEACAAGELRVVVHHSDLLALCRPTGGTA